MNQIKTKASNSRVIYLNVADIERNSLSFEFNFSAILGDKALNSYKLNSSRLNFKSDRILQNVLLRELRNKIENDLKRGEITPFKRIVHNVDYAKFCSLKESHLYTQHV